MEKLRDFLVWEYIAEPKMWGKVTAEFNSSVAAAMRKKGV